MHPKLSFTIRLWSYQADLATVLQYQYFIVDDGDVIKLMTFVWFTATQCNVPQLIEINRFKKKSRTWKTSEFIVKKFETFYGLSCDVWSQQWISVPRIFFRHAKWPSTSLELSNRNQLFRSMASSGQLSRHSRNDGCTSNSWMSQLDPRRTLQDVHDNTVHGDLPGSTITLQFPQGLIIRRTKNLFSPLAFDELTWILIIVTFFVAYATVFVVYRLKQSIRDFVFGSKVSTPSLNISIIFFGIPKCFYRGEISRDT